MSAMLIWMTHDEARFFHVEAATISVDKISYDGPKHPTETSGKNHPQNQTDHEAFFRQLLTKIRAKRFDQVLLMGPGLGAVHFVTYLEKAAADLLPKLIGVERVDKMPDSEILSIGRKHLQRHYLYNPA